MNRIVALLFVEEFVGFLVVFADIFGPCKVMLGIFSGSRSSGDGRLRGELGISNGKRIVFCVGDI